MLRVYLELQSRVNAQGKRRVWKTQEFLDCVIEKARGECERELTAHSIALFYKKCKQEYDAWKNSVRSGCEGGLELELRTPWHVPIFDEFSGNRPSIAPNVLLQSGCPDQTKLKEQLENLQEEETQLRHLVKRYVVYA